METEDYKRELLHIFFAQKRLTFGVTLLVFLGALAVYLLAPVKYAAYGSLLVRAKAPVSTPQSLAEAEARSLPVNKEDLYSEVQMLQSTEVIGRTLTAMATSREMKEALLHQRTSSIRSQLEINVVPSSNVIQIELRSSDREQVVNTLDRLIEEYLRFRQEVSQGRDVESFFGAQADKFRQMLESGEQDLEALYQEVGSAAPDREIETLLLVKRDLELELSQLNSEVVELRANMAQLDLLLQNSGRNKTPHINNNVMQKLNDRLIALRTERSSLLRTYLPGSKAVQKVENEIVDIRHLIRAEMTEFRHQVAAELAVAEEKLSGVLGRMEDIDRRNLELQSQEVATRRLEREASLQQQSYETFTRRREEARIQGAMETNNLVSYVAVLDRAHPSDGPVFPLPILLPLGLATGLLLGLALGFTREYFDHSFKKPSDVDRVLSLPTVFSLGDVGGDRQRP